MDPGVLAAIYMTAVTARGAFEMIWPQWQHNMMRTPSAGNCIVTSHALYRIVQQTVPVIRWRLAGGRNDGGYCDGASHWRPHCWVEGQYRRHRCIVDLTADQFGGPKVVVCAYPNPTHRANLGHSFYHKFFVPPAGDVNRLLDSFANHLQRKILDVAPIIC